jgi:excisionase family DNA binding protein
MELLTAQDVSVLLRVTLHRVYRMARRGSLPVIRVARCLRIDEAKLRAWLDRGGLACPPADGPSQPATCPNRSPGRGCLGTQLRRPDLDRRTPWKDSTLLHWSPQLALHRAKMLPTNGGSAPRPRKTGAPREATTHRQILGSGRRTSPQRRQQPVVLPVPRAPRPPQKLSSWQ